MAARLGDSVIAEVGSELRKCLGDRVTDSAGIRDRHGRGEGLTVTHPPDWVTFPTSTAEVVEIVQLCAHHRVAVIPFGAGSSLEGHVAALRGGVCIDLSQMATILEVNAEDQDCRVEAGVTREDLNTYLRDTGLFFPLDPGHNATLGGMAATRASGTNAVRYGTMREVTLGLTVVTPNGEVIRTGGRARKSSAGYDLTRLYVGSEGTLGVITEVQLRLFGVPARIASGVAQFDDLDSAVRAVMMVIQLGVPVARIELLDSLQMQASINYSKLTGYEAKPTLFLEFHGTEVGVEDQIAQTRDVFEEFNAGAMRWATLPEDRTELWKARHNAYHAAKLLAPGKDAFATDACVPISRLADCISAATDDAQASGLICPIVGHVGDGNFHVSIVYDPNDEDERNRAETLATSVARRAIEMGGTCTGEHGVGIHKRALLREEVGAAGQVMGSVKRALDPLGIMNPGKTLPEGIEAG